jgi:hypothetical protein
MRLAPLPSPRTNHHAHLPLHNKISTCGLAFLLECLELEYGTDRPSQNVSDYQQMLGITLQAGRSQIRFPMVSLGFFIHIILLAELWSWVSTQPLTEMGTRNISWGAKGGRCVGLTTLPP